MSFIFSFLKVAHVRQCPSPRYAPARHHSSKKFFYMEHQQLQVTTRRLHEIKKQKTTKSKTNQKAFTRLNISKIKNKKTR